MSEKVVFTGGQIDLRNLLDGLQGRPFQADIEELFAPFSGAPPQSREGHVMVDSRGRARCDMREEGVAISVVHDPERGVMLFGLGEEPTIWTSTPDRLSDQVAECLPAASQAESAERCHLTSAEVPIRVLRDEDYAMVEGLKCYHHEHSSDSGEMTTSWYSTELQIPVRMTSVTRNGTKLYRLSNIRFEEPGPGSFPDER